MPLSGPVLFVAAAEIGLVGLVYLLAPMVLVGANGMTLESVNEYHSTRAAYGGAFVGFGLLFLAGAMQVALRRTALIALATFMSGFAAGRVVSLVLDGWPAPAFLAILGTEVVLAALALAALRRE